MPAVAARKSTTLEATVTRVSDGDTVWARPDGASPGAKPLKLRLDGIDAPESCQPWGAEATQALRERVLGRRVRLELRGRDKYRRSVAGVWLGAQDLNAWMVREGHAWSYRYRHGAGPYRPLEAEARARRSGLFGAADPMPPQVFRQWHGPCRAGGR
ncbi:thermonuclease family protein [Caldimonas brevitalea]|uniref:Nuclease n=1 Tax=Caldimonas brevitalea TaxID=413882 RepID=A0A0G3BKS5_9BURK|nr:thermonuclease family protein [Caldimonas brevitalea]AKJ27961.1 nuclease [Caldimonas brevitalea]